jgi:SAM-dependent methyltransferase
VSAGERLLLAFSRKPDSTDYLHSDVERTSLDSALSLLKRVFPDFDGLVRGKRVLDFGCGKGFQSAALVKFYESSVLGVDTNPKTLAQAREISRAAGLSPTNPVFAAQVPEDMHGKFDIVISQDSFEHFPEPEEMLLQMISLINPSGRILITFGPPWLAPNGSHMHFFSKLPWVNVFFSEETVMQVRSRFRSDGAKRYEEVESGLNRMTLAKFERIVAACGLRMTLRKYECVKRLNWLASVPLLREFFVNQVTVALSKK